MRKIIHDCDGCLVNYLAGLTTFMWEIHGRVLDPVGPRTYDLIGWLGTSREEILDLLMEFNENRGGYFESLPPLPGAVEAVELFRSMGFSQDIVTACHTATVTKTARISNVTGLFGKFDAYEFVSMAGSKEANFASRSPSFLVEDNIANAIMGARYGHHVFLIDGQQNQVPVEGPFQRVSGWDEIAVTIEALASRVDLEI